MDPEDYTEPAAAVLRRHLLVTADKVLDLIITSPSDSVVFKDLFRLLEIAGIDAEEVAQYWASLQHL